MENETYRWHFDYTRLAWESGFSFESNKNRKTFDRNKIALLDIDRIIRERDIAIVENHLGNILDYNLDNDELKILDNSFVKLFQLYQLSIEFLMYCKKFLDKTVVILKNDLQKNIVDNEYLQKELTRVMSEHNRLKKRNKDLKLTLQYQHQFQQNLNDQMTIYQCNECGKTFINNEYLNSHLKRRHNIDQNVNKENILHDQQQDSTENTLHTTPEHEKFMTETDKLQTEIKVLKEKLNNTERYFVADRSQSPDHGTVKIQKCPMYTTESLNDVKELQKQFEALKNMVQTELEHIRIQKLVSETSTQEHLLQKVFEKLENKHEPQQVSVIPQSIQNERRNSYVQTDEDFAIDNDRFGSATSAEVKNVEYKDSRNINRKAYQNKDERSKSFVQSVDSSTSEEEKPNLVLVKEEVEKKLEEKTKKDIEELEEQLSKKMSTSFNLLEKRMETFWNKFNERTFLMSQSPSPIPAYIDKSSKTVVMAIQSKPLSKNKSITPKKFDTVKYDAHPTKVDVMSSESDSLSETESNRNIPSDIEISEPDKPMPLPRKDKTQQKFVEELKTKVQERKVINETKIKNSDDLHKKNPTKIFFTGGKATEQKVVEKHKLEELSSVQKPVVTKVFSRPIKSQTESETEDETSSESETESSSEDVEEEDAEVPVKQKIKEAVTKKGIRKETPIQRQFMKRSQSAPLGSHKPPTREDILEDYNNRLQKLGIDPDATNLGSKDFKHKSELLLKSRTSIEKKNTNSFTKIRDQILQEIETKIQSISHPNLLQKDSPSTQEISPKPSRFKSLVSSVKTKLMSSIKNEKSPTRQENSPRYRLTVHCDIPQENLSDDNETKQVVTRKIIKKAEKNPVKREKIVIKPKKMYVDSNESETKSDDDVLNKKKSVTHLESARKSISVTSLNASVSERENKKGSVQNIAQSLDSILEMKKEIIAEINREKLEEEKLKNFSSSEESIQELTPKFEKPKLSYRTSDAQKGILTKKKDLVSSNESINETPRKSSPDFWEQKLTYEIPETKTDVHKGVLKNYPSASSLTKKKVIFDLDDLSDTEKFNPPVQKLETVEPKKIKTNSFFDFDLSKDDDSTSVTSSIFDGGKLNLDPGENLQKGKIQTKVQINVDSKSKQNKKESESDFDISDLL